MPPPALRHPENVVGPFDFGSSTHFTSHERIRILIVSAYGFSTCIGALIVSPLERLLRLEIEFRRRLRIDAHQPADCCGLQPATRCSPTTNHSSVSSGPLPPTMLKP